MVDIRLGPTVTQSIKLNLEICNKFHDRLHGYFNKPIRERGPLIAYIKEHIPKLYPEVLALAAKLKLTGELK